MKPPLPEGATAFILPTILIVDDERSMATVLKAALSSYNTIWASDAQAALHLIEHDQPDLILLDLRLPDIDGLQLIGLIRKHSGVPIIVTSARAERVDIVLALQTGADDFISKPFDIDDLEARVEAVLRRSTRLPVPLPPTTHQVGGLTISATQAHVAGKCVYFPPIEHRLLFALAEHPDEPVTLAELSERVWGDNLAGSHLIGTNLSRIRARLRQHPGAPRIETWRKRGLSLRST